VLGPSEGALGAQDAPDGFPASGRNGYPSGANPFFADASLTFSTSSVGTPANGPRIDYLLPDLNSKLVTIFTLGFSPFPFYHPSNHTPSSYEQIIRTKSYAQRNYTYKIICTNYMY